MRCPPGSKQHVFRLSWQDRRGKTRNVSRSGAILQSANHRLQFWMANQELLTEVDCLDV